MKALKKLSIFLCIIICFSIISVPVEGVKIGQNMTKAIMSSNKLWEYTKNGSILAYYGQEESVTLPKVIDGTEMYGVASINNNTVKHITVPINYINVYNFAFAGLKELRSVTFSQGYSDTYQMARFDDYAFAHCPKLEKVVLPNRMVESAFYDGDLKQKIAGGVLPGATFLDCPSLVDVTFPDGLVKVGSSAFRGCTSIEKIVIPEGVLVISVNAFKDTPSLKTLVLPDSVEEKGLNGAFNGVSKNLNVICSPGSAADKKIQYLNEWAPSTYSIASVSSVDTDVEGDVNRDNKFNIADVTTLQKYLVKILDVECVNSNMIDFNGDGIVNIVDCTAMQRALAKISV